MSALLANEMTARNNMDRHTIDAEKWIPLQGISPEDSRGRGTRVLYRSLAAIMVVTLVTSSLLLSERAPAEQCRFKLLTATSDIHLNKSIERAALLAVLPASFQHRPNTGPRVVPVAVGATARVMSCYLDTPGLARHAALSVQDVPPDLCTHINVAFATVVANKIALDPTLNQTLLETVKLKHANPNIKILLSIGGHTGFPEMVLNHANRKVFIKSIKSVLRTYNLDGIDLDWEFPALRSYVGTVGKRERQHFSQLLYEIKTEYIREKRNYLLTVAVGAPMVIADVCYDVDQLDLYADYVNIMTYDFHSFTKYTPLTGLNSPLYPRAMEQYYLATLNINYTVNMYMSKGLSPNKIVVGIPTYGHSYTLFNSRNTAIGSPALDFGALGSLGFVDYPDVCIFLKNFTSEVTVVEDNDAKVPYLYRDHEWVSYDTPQSVSSKAMFIKEQGLRGAMIYSLNADDHKGICHFQDGAPTKFPLSQSVRDTLIGSDKNWI